MEKALKDNLNTLAHRKKIASKHRLNSFKPGHRRDNKESEVLVHDEVKAFFLRRRVAFEFCILRATLIRHLSLETARMTRITRSRVRWKAPQLEPSRDCYHPPHAESLHFSHPQPYSFIYNFFVVSSAASTREERRRILYRLPSHLRCAQHLRRWGDQIIIALLLPSMERSLTQKTACKQQSLEGPFQKWRARCTGGNAPGCSARLRLDGGGDGRRLLFLIR